MRIALLSYEYPPETGFGGIGTYTWFQARALARLGHDVHVLAGATSTCRLRPEEHDGVRVWRTHGGGLPAALFKGLGVFKWWWTRERVRNALDSWTALRVLERERPFDVVEMPECGAEGLLVNRFTRSPTVVRLHSPARLIMPYYDVKPVDVRWCARLEDSATSRATAITSTSQFLARSARDALGIQRPMDVIHNGIDLVWFDERQQIDARPALGLPANKPLILFVGRLERRKGMDLCPAIVAKVLERHDVAFAFAGADPFGYVASTLQPYLQTRTLRGSAHFLGRLDALQVRSCLRQADLVFLPSLWESCPYSCLEAMAAGRAIVASDAGGLPELLRDRENGMVVRSGDIEGFVGALEELLGDAALRARLGSAARRTVEASFRDVETARQSVERYEQLGR